MKQWYAVQTKPHREADAELNLKIQGFDVYLPSIEVTRKRRNKYHRVVEPLFPRYLFIHVDSSVNSIAPVRSTIGVSQLVKFGGHPAVVPDEIIEFFKSNEDEEKGCCVFGDDALAPGTKIEVVGGPFSGFEGVYDADSGQSRVYILLEYLGRVTRLNIDRDHISVIHDDSS